MATFQFSLQRLLELRHLELQQIELRAAAAAAEAAAWKRRHQQLLDQLASSATPEALQHWLVYQHGAQSLREQADMAIEQYQQHEQTRQKLLQEQAAKRSEVEALETLRETEHAEHRRQQRRREEAELQNQILRQWTIGKQATPDTEHAPQGIEQGSVNDG